MLSPLLDLGYIGEWNRHLPQGICGLVMEEDIKYTQVEIKLWQVF